MSSFPTKVALVAKFIREWHQKLGLSRPLFVGFSGCQGCGKTTLTQAIVKQLAKSDGSPSLRALAITQDDFYLTHEEQRRVARENPGNLLLEYRGNAGTHDLDLCVRTLEALRGLHTSSTRVSDERRVEPVRVPRYDKSLHQGRGDRLPEERWLVVDYQVDVVIFEGWMVGFKPLSGEELESRYREAKARRSEEAHVFLPHELDHLAAVNKALGDYQSVDRMMDIFVHIRPLDLQYVYVWRLEQEEAMRATAGGNPAVGLSPDQIRDFVTRFMPAYFLYLPRLTREGLFSDLPSTSREAGRQMQITLDRERNVVSTKYL